MRRIMLFGAALSLSLAAASPAVASDYAQTALNIVPSGLPGAIPAPAGAATQAQMYDSLTPLRGNVTQADLLTAFKSERFGSDDSCPCTPEAVPRPGVTIIRDRFDVPHITGATDDDVTWATGWVLEEDRGLLLSQGRYPARYAALDVPGVDAFSLVTGLKPTTASAQADAIIDKTQTASLKAAGAEGKAVLHDIDVYVTGINARLKVEGSTQKPWTRVDVYSLNALAGQIFGQGGGDEARRSEMLGGLEKKLGKTNGKKAFDDLSEHLDRDTPTTISKSFPYEQVPKHAGSGNANIDPGSMSSATASAASERARTRRYASNFLMVSGKRSTTGHPLFVGGPQIGYFYPGLTLEMDISGPGYQARGVGFPGGSGNLLIGRGQDFAWTLTSAGSDTNDQFVETLCGGSSTKYLYKGKCRTMGKVTAGTISGKTLKYRTTVHGPVLGYAKSNGKKVAISFMRSSYGRDILWEIAFRRMTRGSVKSVQSFYDAVATSPFTFNVGYADDQHIATYSAGRLPLRDKRVDPRLPTKGTGQYEWKGFLKENAHPHEADPASGFLVNWNNKPAPGFGASDSEWSYGATQRMTMLKAGLDAKPTHDLASVVSAMNNAATEDLRVAGPLLDQLTKLLSTGAPNPRDQQLVDALKAWRASGSSRIDTDLDGKMDAGAAPAIMDALYPKLADAVTTPKLGAGLTAELADIEGKSNYTGSGFTGGRINDVVKILGQLNGVTYKTPFKTAFCGTTANCRAKVWKAVDSAAAQLAAKQGSADPAAWTSDANAERISFAPVNALGTIRYTNRPSGIQQVISFGGHR